MRTSLLLLPSLMVAAPFFAAAVMCIDPPAKEAALPMTATNDLPEPLPVAPIEQASLELAALPR